MSKVKLKNNKAGVLHFGSICLDGNSVKVVDSITIDKSEKALNRKVTDFFEVISDERVKKADKKEEKKSKDKKLKVDKKSKVVTDDVKGDADIKKAIADSEK